MAILAIAIAMGFFSDHAEFFKTSNEQMADGYTWANIDCRDVDSSLPALTMETVNGPERVCFKLIK